MIYNIITTVYIKLGYNYKKNTIFQYFMSYKNIIIKVFKTKEKKNIITHISQHDVYKKSQVLAWSVTNYVFVMFNLFQIS